MVVSGNTGFSFVPVVMIVMERGVLVHDAAVAVAVAVAVATAAAMTATTSPLEDIALKRGLNSAF